MSTSPFVGQQPRRTHEQYLGQLTPPIECVNELWFDSPDAKVPTCEFTSSTVPIVAVVGVGYVGSHLVAAFARQYSIIAFDVSKARISELVQKPQIGAVHYTSHAPDLAWATHYLIAVPTDLRHDKTIDTQYLQNAVAAIELYAPIGATVVVESSVAIGMTRQFLEPLMRSKGIKAGMSPERIDPGRAEPPIENIPKIISGLDDIVPGSLFSIYSLYSRVFKDLVQVSKPEVAEMAKLYENCQRMVNIAYANEMADACIELGIDATEVSVAAATKPFGFQSYTAGLGVGGHCIPVNPYYLLSTSDFPILEAATRRMWARPAQIGERIMLSLMDKRGAATMNEQHAEHAVVDPSEHAHQVAQDNERNRHRIRILVVGAAFKRGQAVTSHSPGIALMIYLLSEWNVYVEYADPLVAQDQVPFVPKLKEQTDWNKKYLEHFDVIVVAIKQKGLDMDVLDSLKGVFVETFCS